jgi:hypothetical protein
MLLSSETFLTSAQKCFCFSEFTSVEASFVPNTYPASTSTSNEEDPKPSTRRLD